MGAVTESPPLPHDPWSSSGHVLGKIGLGFVDDGAGPSVVLTPHPLLVDADGFLGFGVLGMLMDLASSTALDWAPPRPFVHADITVHRLRPANGELVANARAVRQGRRTAIIVIDLRDGIGTTVATSTQEIAFKGQPEDAPPGVKQARASFRSMFDGVCRMTRSLEDELGITESIPGSWSMALRPERTNGFGGLHGGVATTLVDAAASGFMSQQWDRPAQTVSAAVRYLSPATVGPFLAQPEVLVDAGGFAVCRVPVIDTGADDRLVILAETHVAAT